MFQRRSRTVHRLLAAGAAAALLTSCGLPGSGADEQVPTITIWSWTSGTEEMVNAYNAAQDDVRVVFERIPAGTAGGYSKMYNAVRAGKSPDLVNVEYPQVPAFVTHNIIQPLSPYGIEDLRGQFPEWAWNQSALGGDVYALPKDMAPQVFLYRADLFAEYGLEVPSTWPEFREVAEQLREDRPDAVIATLGNTDAGLLAGLAWQAGADWFDTSSGAWEVNSTDEASLEVARYWDGMIRDGLVNAEPVFAEKHIADLQQGRSLAMVAAPWMMGHLSRFMPDLAGTWGAAPMPVWDEPVAANYGGSALALAEGADHPEEAMEFARWMATSPEAVIAAAPASAAMPASNQLFDVWQRELEAANPYVQGMDLPRVADAAAQSIPASWEWGPDMTAGFASLIDEMTTAVGQPDGLVNALRRWEEATIEQLELRGFDVTG